MCSQGVIGQTVAFGDELEISFAGLEKDFNLSPLSVDSKNLFF